MQSREFYLRTGPFLTHLTTSSPRLLEALPALYDARCFVERPEFCDFHVSVGSPVLRRWIRPKIEFLFEGAPIFTPSPIDHAVPVFESGLNWAISTTINQYLIIHAAAVERGGRAMIIPGLSGSGKSTLCAGLAFRGWRLLSDELTLIAPATIELLALARPINLKNESIEVVRSLSPGIVFSRPAEDTLKGTVSLAKPPEDSIARMDERARPRWIVFPTFEKGSATKLSARPRAETFVELAANAINYGVLGDVGFNTLAEVVTQSRCFELAYGDLEDAVRLLTELSESA